MYCSTLYVSACPKGTYGRDCASVCKGYCKNGCNSVTGKCDNGCEPGWYTDECHSGELTLSLFLKKPQNNCILKVSNAKNPPPHTHIKKLHQFSLKYSKIRRFA